MTLFNLNIDKDSKIKMQLFFFNIFKDLTDSNSDSFCSTPEYKEQEALIAQHAKKFFTLIDRLEKDIKKLINNSLDSLNDEELYLIDLNLKNLDPSEKLSKKLAQKGGINAIFWLINFYQTRNQNEIALEILKKMAEATNHREFIQEWIKAILAEGNNEEARTYVNKYFPLNDIKNWDCNLLLKLKIVEYYMENDDQNKFEDEILENLEFSGLPFEHAKLTTLWKYSIWLYNARQTKLTFASGIGPVVKIWKYILKHNDCSPQAKQLIETWLNSEKIKHKDNESLKGHLEQALDTD